VDRTNNGSLPVLRKRAERLDRIIYQAHTDILPHPSLACMSRMMRHAIEAGTAETGGLGPEGESAATPKAAGANNFSQISPLSKSLAQDL
jgi:hypothetical protein